MELSDHYKILLELDENWEVSSIDFDHKREEVVVCLSYKGRSHKDRSEVIHDYRPVRRWRHLDTLHYATYIESKVPRLKDKDGKVRTVEIPWASSVQRHWNDYYPDEEQARRFVRYARHEKIVQVHELPVKAIEHRQLLCPMSRIIGGVTINDDLLASLKGTHLTI